jgi:hypothetical protein
MLHSNLICESYQHHSALYRGGEPDERLTTAERVQLPTDLHIPQGSFEVVRNKEHNPKYFPRQINLTDSHRRP